MLEKYQLPNGMTVLLAPSHRAPVVSVQMWVKTGSADEAKGEEGISHFIEHLVFKGSRQFQPGEIASIVEGSGGELNAYTSLDQTVFYVTISREFGDVALKVISEMMGFPTFDPNEIDAEREVVCEEIKRTMDSPGRQASALMFSTIYKTHPYGIPIIGYAENIRKFSTQQILDYYHRRYVPRNMTLLIVGDFDTKKIRTAVGDLFGCFKDYPLKATHRPAEPDLEGHRIQIKKAEFEETYLGFSWKIPGAHHADVPALDVLAIILGQGDSSRLARKLRLEKPLTNHISAFSYTPKDEGFFSVSAGHNAKNLPAILDQLGEELLLIQSEPPSAEELGRAVTSIESDELYAIETVDGISQKLGSFENLFGDPEYYKKYLDQVTRLKPADILEVAKKYLNQNMVVTVLTNATEKPIKASLEKWVNDYTIAKQTLDRLPSRQAAELAAPKRLQWNPDGAKVGQPEKLTLSNGATLILRRDPEVPVFSLQAGFRGGTRVEAAHLGGSAELMAGLWPAGTPKMTEQEIIARTERMASGISATSGRNSVSLRLDSLSIFASEALPIFFEILTEPIFPKEILEREKHVMLERIRAQADNPAQIASQRFMKELFGSHPYSRNIEGTAESIKKITQKDLQQMWKTVGCTENMVVAASGDFDRDRIIKSVESALAGFPRGKKIADHFEYTPPTKDRVVHLDSKKEQTHVMLGYAGLTMKSEDRYVATVIDSILSGQGGRLFLNLRDKNSLAYTVAPMRLEGIDAGFFGAYIGCSPEKTQKALQMLEAEFARLTEELVSPAELDRSIRYTVGSHDIDLQRAGSIGFKMLLDDLYGLNFLENFQYAQILRRITPEDIRRVSRHLFLKPKVIVTVGPQS